VSGGSWQQTASVSVSSGSTVNLGPQPTSGGSWSWSGPNGFSSTSREIDSIPLSSGTNTFTATYTNSCGSTSTQTFTITVSGSATATPTATATASASGTTTGTIGFHLLLGVGTAEDSLVLDGGNYNDLIMSNMIAGVMYCHIVEEGFPGIQFNKDYLAGSIMGQLLQENLETEAYVSSSNLIDPTSAQQAVMGAGQGGPYQINNYVPDMVGGTDTAAGHALINYIAIQKNIGYTVANNAAQASAVTPPSFNNKYYGPMLPTFFHYNDMVSLGLIGQISGSNPPWEPQYNQALSNFINLPNSFLDVILNVAYNQGYYGGLVASYSTEGATATEATVATVNSYSSIWGISNSYQQYPYQVHYYLDQMYDNPIPTTSATTTTTPANHIAFSMSALESVFTNVFELLDYSNGTAAAQFFTASQAQSAFNSALSSNGVSSSATLDLSNASSRATIFAVIDGAIGNIESAVGMKFNATTTNQL
ncbi:MAG: chitin-binding protein, partial [Bryobacteraceae bacterium]